LVLYTNLGIGRFKMRANKTLQLTPSRYASLSYDRASFPFTPSHGFIARSG